ncbi:MAG: hypothetical protein R3F18_20630 [Lysobacterales bacterium]|nr:hypothetical protein [Xanthomonadales bacterium]
MNKTLAFFEWLGTQPAVAGDDQALATLLQSADLPSELREALSRRDRACIESLLGARSNLVCAVFPVQPDGDEPREDEPEQEPAQEPATDRGALAAAA